MHKQASLTKTNVTELGMSLDRFADLLEKGFIGRFKSRLKACGYLNNSR